MSEPTANVPQGKLPLCVDLDGTVLKTDLLYESLAALARTSPLVLLLLPVWFLQGRATLKREIAKRITLNAAFLPFHHHVVDHLRAERASGRKVYLVTASDQGLADAVAQQIGVFDEVIGSDGKRNLKGNKKAAYLTDRFGEGGFEYIGDSNADLAVWEKAGAAAVVSRGDALFNKVQTRFPTALHFKAAPLGPKTIVKSIRAHQWVKNTLVFVPLILAHKILSFESVLSTVWAFAAFSLCASVVYIINDLLDLDADRQHHRKKSRPFANGDLPLQAAFFIIPIFLCGAVAFASLLPLRFAAILGSYFVVTLAYSLYFKQIVLIDIVLLAALYSIRLSAGGAAAQVAVSQWLVAFAMFFFFSLACVKRYSELFGLRRAKEEHSKGRGYKAADLEQIGTFGSSSAYLSILVLALYVSSNEVAQLYHRPWVLWLLCPAVLYWVSRVWLLAHRGEMHDDPIVFALTDRVSYIVGVIAAVIVLAAV